MSLEKMNNPEKMQPQASVETGFDPDKRIELSDGVNETAVYSPDQRADTAERVEGYSTYEDRIEHVPAEDCNYGRYEGQRGESKFIPSDPELKAKLAEYGLDGIDYKDAKPDFGPVAVETVEIDMTVERYSKSLGDERITGNFEKAEKALAQQWNDCMHGGRSDWTRSDVTAWRKENGLTIHECNDMKTCQFVSADIHEACKHYGGVAECKRRDAIEVFGGYDD